MRLNVSSQVSGVPVRFEFLGFGANVAPNTMTKMKDMINAGVRDYYVRRWAEIIAEGSGPDDFSKAQTVYNFILGNTFYLKDPIGVELLKTPHLMLNMIESGSNFGLDCDDLTILSLTLLKIIGIPVALRAVSTTPDLEFGHIYGLFRDKQQGWIPIDLVVGFRGGRLGEEPPMITNIMDREV